MATTKIPDCYRVLGIARDATTRDINSAYKKLALKHHPDKAVGEGSSRDEFQKVPYNNPLPSSATNDLVTYRSSRPSKSSAIQSAVRNTTRSSCRSFTRMSFSLPATTPAGGRMCMLDGP